MWCLLSLSLSLSLVNNQQMLVGKSCWRILGSPCVWGSQGFEMFTPACIQLLRIHYNFSCFLFTATSTAATYSTRLLQRVEQTVCSLSPWNGLQFRPPGSFAILALCYQAYQVSHKVLASRLGSFWGVTLWSGGPCWKAFTSSDFNSSF